MAEDCTEPTDSAKSWRAWRKAFVGYSKEATSSAVTEPSSTSCCNASA